MLETLDLVNKKLVNILNINHVNYHDVAVVSFLCASALKHTHHSNYK